ncbi:hypothetical protein J132_06087 [Termitomyces sp. J132]|nr:hypothetical protein J132_06087 [Termitomyces sp. J132]
MYFWRYLQLLTHLDAAVSHPLHSDEYHPTHGDAGPVQQLDHAHRPPVPSEFRPRKPLYPTSPHAIHPNDRHNVHDAHSRKHHSTLNHYEAVNRHTEPVGAHLTARDLGAYEEIVSLVARDLGDEAFIELAARAMEQTGEANPNGHVDHSVRKGRKHRKHRKHRKGKGCKSGKHGNGNGNGAQHPDAAITPPSPYSQGNADFRAGVVDPSMAGAGAAAPDLTQAPVRGAPATD